MREITPITELAQRVQEHGRIRLGVKTASAMKSISTFRFTSPDGEAIRQLAELYGGQARAWNEPKANPANQFEVITQVNEVDIYLPDEALSIWYETWSAGGCTRRCDGITVQVPIRGQEDEMGTRPCLCIEQGARTCKPYTRINVILPNIRFGGVWRLETKGWNAAHELPAMEALLSQLQGRGILAGRLRLEQRKTVRAGKTKHYVVPVIVLNETPQGVLAGAASVAALGQADRPALGPAPPSEKVPPYVQPPSATAEDLDEDWFDPDNDVVDAELVESEGPPPTEPPDPASFEKRQQTKFVMLCGELAAQLEIPDADLRHAVATAVTNRRTSSSKELSTDERSKAIDAVQDVLDRKADLSIKDGWAVIKPRQS